DDDFSLEMDGDPDVLDDLLREIEEQSQLQMLQESSGIQDKTLRDLMIALLGKFDSDTPLVEIRLNDLLSTLLELQNTDPRT
ncbi:MAG: hypothetical protein GX294_02940, partial [Candidatus Cloacimonetes bacterium]|nr:hypothetical protein [Candidatus Cloacimonadota bacterium]